MMGDLIVVKANSRQEMDDFVRVVYPIYKDCPQWVPDLESEVRDTFNPKKNPGLEFSDIQPFVAYRGKTPVGRVAGIINRHANERWRRRVVRFSMIEFEDDPEVSKALIGAVEDWGRAHGMDTLQGPMGITDFDKEGMLVEDFHLTGSLSAIYNPDYYPRHMEALGMKKEVDWLQVRIQIPETVPARYSRVAQYAREQIGLRVIKVTYREAMNKGYGRQVFELLNEAYKPIFGFSQLSEAQIEDFLKKYLSIIDMNLIPIVMNQQDEMVGVAVTMGSMARAMQQSRGRLWPFGWYPLLRALKWHHDDHAEMLLIAVRPDYQGLGVNALFFDNLIPIYNKEGFRWAETGPQLETNVRELSQWKPLKPEFVKRRRCFTKGIDN